MGGRVDLYDVRVIDGFSLRYEIYNYIRDGLSYINNHYALLHGYDFTSMDVYVYYATKKNFLHYVSDFQHILEVFESFGLIRRDFLFETTFYLKGLEADLL